MGRVYKSQMRTLLYSYHYLLPLWQSCYEHCSCKLITEDLWLCLTLIFVVMEMKKHSRIVVKLKMCTAYLEGEALKMAMTFDSEMLGLSAEPLPCFCFEYIRDCSSKSWYQVQMEHVLSIFQWDSAF